MKQHVFREGLLFLDEHKRYFINESEVMTYQMVTLTSGCTIEVWLNHEWIMGCVEGDGHNYWLFAKTGGKFLLSEYMTVRYREPR